MIQTKNHSSQSWKTKATQQAILYSYFYYYESPPNNVKDHYYYLYILFYASIKFVLAMAQYDE